MAESFSLTQSEQAGRLQIIVRGMVNEKAEFPKIPPVPELYIDLEKVEGLNSTGTRNWCFWVRQIPSPTQIYLEKCPILFVKAFNQISGALPSNASVQSFFVPFIADESGERKDILFVRDENFSDSSSLQIPVVFDSGGKLMEMDVLQQSYFEFLKRK